MIVLRLWIGEGKQSIVACCCCRFRGCDGFGRLGAIVGDAAGSASRAKRAASPTSSGRGRVRHQEAVVPEFVKPEFFTAFFFSARRFFVTVCSDRNGCSCALKAFLSKPSRRPRYS